MVSKGRKRTKYVCFKACRRPEQLLLPCEEVEEQRRLGYICHTDLEEGYRTYGPASLHSAIYQKLKFFPTGIERTFGLVKENRYRMEHSNPHTGIDNITIHAIEHDIVLRSKDFLLKPDEI